MEAPLRQVRGKRLLADALTLEAGAAALRWDPHGGRLTSLRIEGFELLLPPTPDPIVGGAYGMAPWAGRIRNGRFGFRGQTYTLPANLGPHAIHGTTFTQPWRKADDHWECGLDGWPFAGRAVQRLELTRHRLVWQLEVVAAEAMPVTLGWHPWFVSGATLDLALGARYRRDAAGIPDGQLVEAGPGPWDDCFRAAGPHTLRWPGLSLTITSDCDHVVVYNERADAFCVEPQSGPPDAANLGLATVLEPGDALKRTMILDW